ncbi:MarR family transcriptional regulator [Jatrophihabitans sp.]|uniref:MarR family winged helix-turn-helix transcriptional regulator n=1 Tax=Jatrophihabitans sp. TaxID=1932789 RepID=UPI0030C76D3C|nr:putative MarR family transcriptional regulator [Jatrophihabitans sp.]
MDADRSVLLIEVAISAIISWATRQDVRDETMRRARCDLPPGHAWLLARLSSCGPLRIGALALALGIDASTITPQIQRLERDGLITRSPDPSDGRAALVAITPDGSRMLARLQRSRQAMLKEKLQDWPAHERESVAAVIDRLASALAPA